MGTNFDDNLLIMLKRAAYNDHVLICTYYGDSHSESQRPFSEFFDILGLRKREALQ